MWCGGGYSLCQEEARYFVEQHLVGSSRHFCEPQLAASLASRCQIQQQQKSPQEIAAEHDRQEARLASLGLKRLPAGPSAVPLHTCLS
jgi:hypothetical protein